MRKVLPILVVSLAFGLAGCGGTNDETHYWPTVQVRSDSYGFGSVSVYVNETTNDRPVNINGVSPAIDRLDPGNTTSWREFFDGNYQFVITRPGSKTIVDREFINMYEFDRIRVRVEDYSSGGFLYARMYFERVNRGQVVETTTKLIPWNEEALKR
jgi:hypothetical protein